MELRALEPSIRALMEAPQAVIVTAPGPYKQAVQQEAPANRFNTNRVTQPVRSETARLKMEELRRLSSPNTPWCFRCGLKGHLAPACRNTVVGFACNRLGHRSSQCRAIWPANSPVHPLVPPSQPPLISPPIAPPPTQINTPLLPTPPFLATSSNPSFPSTATPIQSNLADRDPMPSNATLHPAIMTFHATAASENLEAAFKMSFLLTDVEKWGLEWITAALYSMSGSQSRHQWVVGVFDDYRYLILAPSQFLLDFVLPKHTLHLENRDIPIQ